jgi:hypothetical protein
MAGSRNKAGSWLGGYPDWINDAAYPHCPKCKKMMMYLGGLDLDYINSFTFVCRECCMGATTYDCT